MIERSLRLRKKVYVPRILKSAGKLEICEIKNLEKGFALNSLGIREPYCLNLKTFSPNKIDAVVTPGLAFDGSGGRIGFGGGITINYFWSCQANLCALVLLTIFSE